jgi:4-amino-4-deoxy-L-arabinose transferase-like glycosyltransferase
LHPLLSLFSSWSQRRLFVAFAVILLPVAYISLFYRLGSAPVVLWDESRLGMNALEMLNNKNWLVTYAFGTPDLWNTKPPLLIWIQASLFWLFGANEITLRIPSALAGLATTALVAWFGTYKLKSPLVGLFSALILLTTNGYIDNHVTRSGDYDSLLVFFTTWYVLSFYLYLEEGHRRYLWYTGIGITLALLTKSAAGAIFLPALLLYTILRKQLLPLLRRKEVYVMVAGIVGTVALFFIARESAGAGYLHAMYENDLGGRMLNDLSGNNQVFPWDAYLQMLIHDELIPWICFFPIGFVLLLHSTAPRIYRHIALLIALVVPFFLFVISSAKTKYFWYEAPIYPFCALLAGVGLAFIFQATITALGAGQQPWLLLLLMLCIFAYPLSVVWSEDFQPVQEPDFLFGRHIKYQAKEVGQIENYTLLSGLDYNSSMEFYRLAAMRKYHHKIRPLPSWRLREIKVNETVVVCNPVMRARLDSIYTTTPILSGDQCVTLLIVGKK